MINKEFKLFSNCLPVKGINRGVLVDVQRQNYHILPNEIIDFINEYSGKKVYNLFQDFKNHKSILKKYMRYFLTNELVILTENSAAFPAISSDFDRPFVIDTVTLDLNLSIASLCSFFSTKTDSLGICCLRLVSEDLCLQKLYEIFQFLENSKIKTIVLFVKYRQGFEQELAEIKSKFTRIAEIVFYDVDKETTFKKATQVKFIFENKSLIQVLSMQIHNHNDFLLTIETFNEALKYSSVYNRTIYIDRFGNIKRHIEDQSVFGNIDIDDLNDVVKNQKIKLFWEISKDKIKVCKDCEFRYICPDGSIPFKEKETDLLYTTQTQCNYDPYENLWIDTKNK
jgi:SPASM domain peptide maturase of grasp-with-spasm system